MASDHADGDAYRNEDAEKGDDFDESKVKFINGGKSDDVAVDVADPKKKTVEFAGMNKEELMQYANDPFWKKVRLVLFIGFWVIWLVMLVAAIIIIVLAPKCPPRPDLDWYQTKPMYNILVRSFKDTNGDGIGDLNGVTEKIPYLKDLGVGAIILSPIYQCGFNGTSIDAGFDVNNQTAVDDQLGTMEDFETLLKTAHKERMKVILDFIPNHTGKYHPWWLKFVRILDERIKTDPKNKTNKVARNTDYYMYLDAANRRTTPWVVAGIEGAMQFWLDKGVDGFRFNAMSNLVEVTPPTMNQLDTVNQNETFNLTARFRAVLDTWYGKGGFDQTKLMLTDSLSIDVDPRLYGTEENPGTNLVMNYDLTSSLFFNDDTSTAARFVAKFPGYQGLSPRNDSFPACNAECVKDKIEKSLKKVPEGQWPTWVISTINTARMARALGNGINLKLQNAKNTLLLTLPGTPIMNYGDEIGMVENDKINVKEPRFNTRCPMQWTSKANAGFTNSTPYVALAPDYTKYNVKSIDAHGADLNYLDVVREVNKLREDPAFAWGTLNMTVVNDNILSYVRKAEGHPGYLVAMNLGATESSDDYTSVGAGRVPASAKGTVVMASFKHEDFAVGNEVEMNNVLLREGNVVIFKLE